MKKILWFSNCILSDTNNKASGSWLYSMSNLLISDPNIHLINIAVSKGVSLKDIKHLNISENFEEYILPKWKLGKNGFPQTNNCLKLENICKQIKPDLIHVWGLENYFSKLLPGFKLTCPLLLEIQGLHETCAKVFYGDLSVAELFQCFGLREILFPFQKSIFSAKSRMQTLGEKERETIKLYKFISTQSQWIRDCIYPYAYKAKVYETDISLREQFWKTKKWEYLDSNRLNFYCSAAGAVTYKSMQTAIRALSVVVRFYPNAKLYVIGNFKKSDWLHQSGYLTFFYKLIKRHNLFNNVVFTGPLNAEEIIGIMHKCIGMIQPSYVESYSLAVAEAQVVGVPIIVSFAGAMPELATNRISALFFSPGDYQSCASRMIELIENKDLAERLSLNSIQVATDRNNDQRVLKTQLSIYTEILKNENI